MYEENINYCSVSDNYNNHEYNNQDDYILWKGNWESSMNYSIYGSIEILLKKHNIGTYNSEAIITFDGCYNSNETITFTIEVTSTEIETLTKCEVTFLEFVGYIDNQRIEYSISEYNHDKIIGIYKSYDPDDAGTIELIPTVKKNKKENNNWCVLC